MTFNSVKEFEDYIKNGLAKILQPKTTTMTDTETRIYQVIKDNLDEHLTLNNNVSLEVGCAECMSKVMQLAGVSVPSHGIAGTAALLAWFISNPDFVEKTEPEQGAFVVFATGTGNGKVEGHTGAFCAFNVMYVNDWGVASNDSNTGTMREQWAWLKMLAYYRDYGGIQPRIFATL